MTDQNECTQEVCQNTFHREIHEEREVGEFMCNSEIRIRGFDLERAVKNMYLRGRNADRSAELLFGYVL